MTTLIIDNYDSFTWNLYQLVGALGGAPIVVRNDAIDLAGVRAMKPSRIILSPGPGRPDDAKRVGVMPAIIAGADVPILGVCLGHQCIVHTFGGTVVRGEPVHGKSHPVEHDGKGLFAGLPNPFDAMRYHSLVARTLPPGLVATAWLAPQVEPRKRCEAPAPGAGSSWGGGVGGEASDVDKPCKDGTLMGVRHESRPIFGVQFHPESVGTPHGAALCRAFLRGDFT